MKQFLLLDKSWNYHNSTGQQACAKHSRLLDSLHCTNRRQLRLRLPGYTYHNCRLADYSCDTHHHYKDSKYCLHDIHYQDYRHSRDEYRLGGIGKNMPQIQLGTQCNRLLTLTFIDRCHHRVRYFDRLRGDYDQCRV